MSPKISVPDLIYAADLFCGGGGFSSGLLEALEELGLSSDLVAVNHWDLAIATHSLNHPSVRHYNCDLETMNPRDAIPGGFLHLLIGSPPCTHFSNARGGKPVSEQMRASANYILKWIDCLDEIREILLENVREWMTWGPLHRCHCIGMEKKNSYGPHESTCKKDFPIESRKGEYFRKFIKDLEARGYTVKYHVLNCANYGDPTTRKRLFLRASLSGRPTFPNPSHSESPDLFASKQWRPIKECLDLNNRGKSIFQRGNKSLSKNTIRRIEHGLRKYSGLSFVLGQQSGAAARTIDQPGPTIAGAGAIGLAQPFIVPQFSGSKPIPLDVPLGTITTQSRGIGMAQPFLIPCFGDNESQDPRTASVDKPVGTLTGSNTFGLAQPFIVAEEQANANGKQIRSTKELAQTITGRARLGVATPFIVQADMGGRVQDIEQPIGTLTSADARSVVSPFLVEYYGTGDAQSVSAPLPTQTGKDRFGLVQPVFERDGIRYKLEIYYRMLTPRELARAMSFREDYQFVGNREAVVKQIGNSVPVKTARALCYTALKGVMEYAQ